MKSIDKIISEWKKALRNKWVYKKSENTFYYTKYKVDTIVSSEVSEEVHQLSSNIEELIVAKYQEDGKLHINYFLGGEEDVDFLTIISLEDDISSHFGVTQDLDAENVTVMWSEAKVHSTPKAAASQLIKYINSEND